MASNSNPFADDQPPAMVRLEAADVENPYAAPTNYASADGRELILSRNPDGGLWRQGWLLVAHRRAEFPERCVRTNVPTVERVDHPIPSARVMDSLWRPQLTLRYAVAPPSRQQQNNLRMFVVGAFLFLTSLPVMIGWFTFDSWGIGDGLALTLLLSIPALIFLLIVSLGKLTITKHPLRLVATDGDFRWLSGGGRDFLNSLPQWPGRA